MIKTEVLVIGSRLAGGIAAAPTAAENNVAKFRNGDDYFPDTKEWKTEIVDPALIAQNRRTIKNTMWNYFGLIR